MLKSDLHTQKPQHAQPRKPYGRHARLRERSIVAGRVVVALATVAVVALAGVGWWLWTRANDEIQSKAVAGLVTDDPNIRQVAPPAADVDTNPLTPENILILGLNPSTPGQDISAAAHTDVM